MAYTTDQIGGFYKQYLGRDLSNSGEAQGWLDNPDAENMIKNSGEGQAFARNGYSAFGGGTPGAGGAKTPDAIYPKPGSGAIGDGVPGAPKPQADQWGNAAGSQQAGTDAFWNAIVNQKQRTFDPAQLQQWGVTQISPDKYRLANGQEVDTIADIGGPNEKLGQWTISGGQPGQNGQGVNWGADPSGKTLFGGSGAAGAGGYGSSGGSSFGSSSSTGGMVGYGTNAQRDELYAELMARAKQGLAVDANDPNIKQQVDPFRAEQDRAQRNFMADLAEKAGANYGASNLEGQSRVSHEQAGRNTGNFQATLIGKELDSKRTEIQNALSQRGSMLTQEQQLAMQRELAQINAALRQQEINSGNDQFMGSLGLQSENQNNYWDAVRSGLL